MFNTVWCPITLSIQTLTNTFNSGILLLRTNRENMRQNSTKELSTKIFFLVIFPSLSYTLPCLFSPFPFPTITTIIYRSPATHSLIHKSFLTSTSFSPLSNSSLFVISYTVKKVSGKWHPSWGRKIANLFLQCRMAIQPLPKSSILFYPFISQNFIHFSLNSWTLFCSIFLYNSRALSAHCFSPYYTKLSLSFIFIPPITPFFLLHISLSPVPFSLPSFSPL